MSAVTSSSPRPNLGAQAPQASPAAGGRELARTLWAFRREFLLVAALSGVANLMMLTPSIYMLQVFDRVMISQSELTLVAVSLVTVVLLVVMAMSEWLRSAVLVRAGMRFDERLSSRVFGATFEAHLNASRTPPRAFSDLIQVRQFLTGAGIIAILDAPWAPIYIAVTFLLHPMLGYLALVFVLIQALLAWFGHRHTVAPAEAAARAQADATAFLQSKLRNAELLESMGMIGHLRRRWARIHEASLEQSGAAQGLTHRVTAVSKFIRYSQQSLSLGAGALLVIQGEMSPGAMIAANLLMVRALAPIDQLVATWRGYITSREAYRRLGSLLAEYPPRTQAYAHAAPSGLLSLVNVQASAAGREEPILKDISLTVQPGTVVAILGPSGSGKSTLARVMVGIWPQVEGEVLLDGEPLSSWDRVALGPHLGYLPQDIELFDGTLAENIARLGKVDSDQVIAAARATGLHEMILRFPKGYDTPIGEAGGLLSGGQRQRLALARAVYGNPSLIVLDEPNAHLDDVGEAALLATVRDLRAQGKTVFLVSHRPSAVQVADRLMILREGRLIADGPRDTVLAQLRANSL